MRVVFLDIDGVLNSSEWFLRRKKEGREVAPCKELDRSAVLLLNEIVSKTDAKIVISSSWRLAFDLEFIISVLEKHGFNGEVLGRTPHRTTFPVHRGNEIQDWLDGHPEVTEFCIIDDDQDMLEHQMSNFVHTTWAKGLQPEHVEKAIRILNGT